MIESESLDGLPAELLEQLSAETVRLSQLARMNLPEEFTINHVLIGFYRGTGEIKKRTEVNAILYRLAKKRLITAIAKGVYSLRPATQGPTP